MHMAMDYGHVAVCMHGGSQSLRLASLQAIRAHTTVAHIKNKLFITSSIDTKED